MIPRTPNIGKRKHCTKRTIAGSLSEEKASAKQLPILSSVLRRCRMQQFVKIGQFPLFFWSIASERGTKTRRPGCLVLVVSLGCWLRRVVMNNLQSIWHMWSKYTWLWPSWSLFPQAAIRTPGPHPSCSGSTLSSGRLLIPILSDLFSLRNELSETTSLIT